MHVKRRRLPNFEACSVALFASLALYGPLPSKAQTATSSPTSCATSPTGRARGNPTIPSTRLTPEQLRQAFNRLDAEAGLQLSSNEFDPVAPGKDGSISSAAFDESLK